MRLTSTRALIALACCAMFGLTACGNDGTSAADQASKAVETASSAASDAGTAASDAVKTATSEAGKAASSASESAGENFTMPNLVGMNLQTAQDTLQKQGSYLLDQQDAKGLNRVQVNDSNWKVCVQEPAANASVRTDQEVVLKAVKNDEKCP